MLRVSAIWPYYSLMKRIIIPIANTKSSSSLLQMLGQHDQQENLPSEFPTTTTPPNISTPTDAAPAVADSPFVPDFDAIPPIRLGENPPMPSPSPTAPRTDSPEFSDPPNTTPPGHEAPRPPTSPSRQPDSAPPKPLDQI